MVKKKEKTKEEKNLYSVSVTFDIPTQGSILVAANSEDEATKFAHTMFIHQKNVNVFNVLDLKDCPKLEDYLKQMNENQDIEVTGVLN